MKCTKDAERPWPGPFSPIRRTQSPGTRTLFAAVDTSHQTTTTVIPKDCIRRLDENWRVGFDRPTDPTFLHRKRQWRAFGFNDRLKVDMVGRQPCGRSCGEEVKRLQIASDEYGRPAHEPFSSFLCSFSSMDSSFLILSFHGAATTYYFRSETSGQS